MEARSEEARSGSSITRTHKTDVPQLALCDSVREEIESKKWQMYIYHWYVSEDIDRLQF